MVHVFFFVVSGYALSHKPLQLLRRRDYGGLQGTLASGIFRRALRLFLPIVGLTLALTVLIRIGGPFAPLPMERRPTLLEQLRDWFNAMWTISSFSWTWEQVPVGPPYDMALWTIPIEFCNSLLLFVVLMGLSRLKTHLRLALLCGITICLKCAHWASFEFLMGMALAEIGLIQGDRRERAAMTAVALEDGDAEGLLYSEIKSSSRFSTSSLATLFFTANFIVSLFLAGWPAAGADQTPVISTLWRITMEPFLSTGNGDGIANFGGTIAATLMVSAVQQVSFLQSIFTTRLAQYLGDLLASPSTWSTARC